MTDQIDAAIAAAQEAANQAPSTDLAAPASMAVAPASGPMDMGLTGFLTAGGINPDLWIKVSEDGIKLDKNQKALIEEFEGTINFANVKLFQGARVQLPGGKYEYIKTYDGVTEARSGKPFAVALSELNARSVGDGSSPYRGADIPVKLTKSVKQGGATIEKGTVIGITTSVTGFKPFQSFLNTVIQGQKVTVSPDGRSMEGEVVTKISHETKTNADYSWGILNFVEA